MDDILRIDQRINDAIDQIGFELAAEMATEYGLYPLRRDSSARHRRLYKKQMKRAGMRLVMMKHVDMRGITYWFEMRKGEEVLGRSRRLYLPNMWEARDGGQEVLHA